MTCRAPLLFTTMFFALFALSIFGFFLIRPVPCVTESQCADGRVCVGGMQCCEQDCCAVAVAAGTASASAPARSDNEPLKEAPYIYPWYTQWSVLFLLTTLGGILICCAWCLFCRRTSHGVYCSLSCCVRRRTSDRDSAGSVYPPPHYSRCGSFHQAPPPYSEVTSKPDLYPLVITCGEGDGKAGGNYLMVHYFKNYVIRAPGSLSAASTAESLNSSFICKTANEANTIIPPPYSCASNYEECSGVGCGRSLLHSLSSLTAAPAPAPAPAHVSAPASAPASATAVAAGSRSRAVSDTASGRSRDSAQAFRDNLITSPVQALDSSFDLELELIDCDLYCEGGCKPRLGASPPVSHSPPSTRPPRSRSGDYNILHYYPCPSPENAGACESPPQPTSPTQSRESTLRRPNDERRHRRLESVKKTSKTRKSSLYMPLSGPGGPRGGRQASSRSAPATPCGGLVPNLLTFTQRVSASRLGSRSSRFEEESNPLLSEIEQARPDHKF